LVRNIVQPVWAGISLKASRATEARRSSNSFSVRRPSAVKRDLGADPALGARGGVGLQGEVPDLLLLGVGEDLRDVEDLDGVAGGGSRQVEQGDDGHHEEQPDEDRFRVQAGSVLIIIRLVVLTHGQGF
jgi:hypothetical protein